MESAINGYSHVKGFSLLCRSGWRGLHESITWWIGSLSPTHRQPRRCYSSLVARFCLATRQSHCRFTGCILQPVAFYVCSGHRWSLFTSFLATQEPLRHPEDLFGDSLTTLGGPKLLLQQSTRYNIDTEAGERQTRRSESLFAIVDATENRPLATATNPKGHEALWVNAKAYANPGAITPRYFNIGPLSSYIVRMQLVLSTSAPLEEPLPSRTPQRSSPKAFGTLRPIQILRQDGWSCETLACRSFDAI